MIVRLDLALYITVPLGYYVPWMNWLAFLNVAAMAFFLVIAAGVISAMSGKILDIYDEKNIQEITSRAELSPNSVALLGSMGLMYYFGWELPAWLCFGSWIIVFIVIKSIIREHNRRLNSKSILDSPYRKG